MKIGKRYSPYESLVDELWCNVLRYENSKKNSNVFFILHQRMLHSSSSNIDSYGGYLFVISIKISHELSEYRHCFT